MNQYYQILKLEPGASKDEIKRAYRKLALIYHPDRNKSSDAEDQFIKISEAYELLMNYRKPLTPNRFEQQQREAVAKAEEEARRKAYEYARMKRQEFMNSDAYKIDRAGGILLEHFHIYSAYFMLIGMPLLGLLMGGLVGLAVAGVILFLSWAYWTVIFTNEIKLDYQEFKESWAIVIRAPGFQSTLILMFGTYVLLTSFLDSVVPHDILLLILFLLIGAVFLVFMVARFNEKPIQGLSYFYSIPLFLFSLFFYLNDTFSNNTQIETYYFKQGSQYVTDRYRGSHRQSTSMIYLENWKYENAPGLRFFFDYQKLRYTNQIQFEFEDGFFGVKVMKEYKLKR